MARTNQNLLEPTQRLINQQSNDKLNRSCPICLEIFNNDRYREMLTTCGHSFCEICLQRTLKIKPFCPFCRQYQGQDKHNNQDSESIQLDQSIHWSPEVVRALYGNEEIDEEGRRMRTIYLSNGERTNIHVGHGAKINVSPNANITINGKQVQNPSDCSQQ